MTLEWLRSDPYAKALEAINCSCEYVWHWYKRGNDLFELGRFEGYLDAADDLEAAMDEAERQAGGGW